MSVWQAVSSEDGEVGDERCTSLVTKGDNRVLEFGSLLEERVALCGITQLILRRFIETIGVTINFDAAATNLLADPACSIPSNEHGFAFQGGLTINLPRLAPGGRAEAA